MSTVTEEEFRKLCKNHDLTYEYSDDHRYWTKGNQTLAEVQAKAKELDREVAVRIWNEVVDQKIVEGRRDQWYWKV